MRGPLILKLEEEIRKIEVGAFDAPPETLEKFRELVGMRNGLKKTVDIINELEKEDDERGY
jgi:hypothetical protein